MLGSVKGLVQKCVEHLGLSALLVPDEFELGLEAIVHGSQCHHRSDDVLGTVEEVLLRVMGQRGAHELFQLTRTGFDAEQHEDPLEQALLFRRKIVGSFYLLQVALAHHTLRVVVLATGDLLSQPSKGRLGQHLHLIDGSSLNSAQRSCTALEGGRERSEGLQRLFQERAWHVLAHQTPENLLGSGDDAGEQAR